MTTRPLVTVFSTDGTATESNVPLPAVMSAPLRSDLVQFVHTNMAKNSRQAYAVNIRAGKQVSASSWGTGRAVARIPRVGGGGTSRSGQGAFGNMCRGGRMFAPTKTWRKWHRKINTTQKRYAVASAVAATAVPALLMARGHKIDNVPEVPLVLDDAIENVAKTSAAKDVLNAVGGLDDVTKVVDSKKIRAGKGKMRNRRYVMRRGPLVIYSNNDGIEKGFRNLPGVELCSVERLNLLQLAPGGHMGRFCIWSKSAIEALDTIYGEGGKRIPAASMSNADLARIINSDEIQSIVNPMKEGVPARAPKRNALKNIEALAALDPYAAAARKAEARAAEARASNKDAVLAKRRASKKSKKANKAGGAEFFEKASQQGDVCEEGFTP